MSINKQNEATEAVPLLAQNDPLMLKNARLRRPLVVIALLVALTCIIVGLVIILLHYGSPVRGILLCILGAFVLLSLPAMMLIQANTRNNLHSKQRQREVAIQQPERFMLPTQPTPEQDMPQPTTTFTNVNTTTTILIMGGVYAVIWFIGNQLLTPSGSARDLLAKLSGSLFFGLVMGIATVLLNSQTNRQLIEVSKTGITTAAFGMKRNQIAWQDVLLFTASANSTTPTPDVRKHPVYELVSAQTIVRWQWQRPLIAQLLKTDPHMSRDEYNRWMEHLHGYIVARTNLPLLNLDAVTLEK